MASTKERMYVASPLFLYGKKPIDLILMYNIFSGRQRNAKTLTYGSIQMIQLLSR